MDSEITVAELKYLLDAGDELLLVDVRESDELAKAKLNGVLHIPMAQIPQRLAELRPADQAIVVMCHVGARSERVAAYLRENGFPNVANLAGGIDAWSREIDRSVPLY
ncbi:MAG TPA: rhodanese-like domain-containing protein [Candidatus Baltobacteraceae bacterium]|nr:rhodanese-like domain-containing protein [Candidatus Baltobacteraceae bacterium]